MGTRSPVAHRVDFRMTCAAVVCCAAVALTSGCRPQGPVVWDANYRALLGESRARQLAGETVDPSEIVGPQEIRDPGSPDGESLPFVMKLGAFVDQLLQWRSGPAGREFLEIVARTECCRADETIIILEELVVATDSGMKYCLGRVVRIGKDSVGVVSVCADERSTTHEVTRGQATAEGARRIRWGLGLLSQVSGGSKPFCTEWELCLPSDGHRVAFITVVNRDGMRQFLHDYAYYDESEGGRWIEAQIYTEYQLVGRFWGTIVECEIEPQPGTRGRQGPAN